MLKLNQIYIKKFAVLFFSLFLVAGAIVYYSMQDLYIKQIKKSLLSQINLIDILLKNPANLDNISKKIKQKLQIRVTFIDENGTVLAESDKDKSRMDNHRYRPEIMQARKNGTGYSIRKSATLNKELLYMAKKLHFKNRIIYVRVAKEIKKIYGHVMALGLKISVIILLFFGAVFYIIYNIGRDIETEVNKITKFLINLTKKRKNIYINSTFCKEFNDITKLLTKVANILSKRDRQKAKYTAKLKTSNRQKDDIISAISHEFKNPITVINGYSKTLIDDPNINKEISQKFLQKIYANGEKLSNLIDTLRLSVKLDSKNIKTSFDSFMLKESVEEISDNLKQSYEREIKILQRDKDVIIKADKSLFCIALSNLIENALKYSEEEIEIIITKKSISVKDKGVGIDEKELKKITKKFYRVSQNSWNNSLGLGLNIVSNILSLHNFKLEIESKKGEGSTFKILF